MDGVFWTAALFVGGLGFLAGFVLTNYVLRMVFLIAGILSSLPFAFIITTAYPGRSTPLGEGMVWWCASILFFYVLALGLGVALRNK